MQYKAKGQHTLWQLGQTWDIYYGGIVGLVTWSQAHIEHCVHETTQPGMYGRAVQPWCSLNFVACARTLFQLAAS